MDNTVSASHSPTKDQGISSLTYRIEVNKVTLNLVPESENYTRDNRQTDIFAVQSFINLKSLDPRVTRLPQVGEVKPKKPLDQLGTFEVFVQAKEGKPFQHEGAIHAPNLEMAYVLAKETFTRRFTCTSIYVADTRDVLVSPISEGNQSAYELIQNDTAGSQKKTFEIYQLAKRGKQHVNAGAVEAGSPTEAMLIAKDIYGAGKVVYNVWAIDKNKIRFTSDEEKDLWLTLPEKKFRDASDYKGGDKLKEFLEKQKN